jgi:hypothetical protein
MSFKGIKDVVYINSRKLFYERFKAKDDRHI